MKQSIFLATCALACGAVFAQAPASPSSPTNPASPTSPAATEAVPPAGTGIKPGGPMGKGGPGTAMGGMGGGHMGMDMKAIDTNGDGMISKKEFDGHHQAMWKKMKSKNGMVSIADMEAMMMQGGRN
jgi:EF hand